MLNKSEKLKVSEKDLKKIQKIRKEAKSLVKGKRVSISLGGPFYLKCHLEWQEDMYPSINNWKIISNEKNGEIFAKIINEDCISVSFDDNFGSYPEVKEFKNRIDACISKCEKLDKKYGKSNGYFWDSFIFNYLF